MKYSKEQLATAKYHLESTRALGGMPKVETYWAREVKKIERAGVE